MIVTIFTESADLVKILEAVGKFLDWHDLGLKFGLEENTLQTISINNGRDVASCRRDMFSAWLKWEDNVEQHGKPSWRRLIQVMAKSNKELASTIEKSTPWLSS